METVSHPIKTFRDLIAWQRAMQLAKEIYRITTAMPTTERYSLTLQIRRAAVSVPSNIAEGYARQSKTDYVRFLKVARGSLAELETQLILCEELEFLQLPTSIAELRRETDRVLQGLIHSLMKQR